MVEGFGNNIYIILIRVLCFLNISQTFIFLSNLLPDIASSEFILFHSLQNALNVKTFSQQSQVEMFVENFLNLEPVEF